MLQHYDPDAGEWFTMQLSAGRFTTEGEQWYVVVSVPRSVLGVTWTEDVWRWEEHADDIVALCTEAGGGVYGATDHDADVLRNAFGDQVVHVQHKSCLVQLGGADDIRKLVDVREKCDKYGEWCVMSCSEEPRPAERNDWRGWFWNLDYFLGRATILNSIVSSAEGQVFIAGRCRTRVREIIKRMA